MQPSPLELTRDQLLATLRDGGVRATPAQLRRWIDVGLLPPPRRVGLGRGRGTTALYPRVALLHVIYLVDALKLRRNLDDAGWRLWVIGLEVAPFVRGLLMREWLEIDARANATARNLKDPKVRARLQRQALGRHRGAAAPVFRDLDSRGVIRTAELLAHLQAGTLHLEEVSDDDLLNLQDAVVALEAPEIRDALGLLDARQIRGQLHRRSRALAGSAPIRALNMTSDEWLRVFTNEAQAIYSMFAVSSMAQEPFIPRDRFREYFIRRVADPTTRGETAGLIAKLGWTTPPERPLKSLLPGTHPNPRGRRETK